MDRISWFTTIRVILMALLLSVPSLRAELVMVQDIQSRASSDGYPPSSFGSDPADPIQHRSEDVSTVEFSGADRAPAGMVFDGESVEPQGRAPSSPVRKKSQQESSRQSPELRSASKEVVLPVAPSQADAQDLIPRGQKGIQEVALIAGDLGYFPKTFFVNRDMPVRLFVTGASKKPLCIMMDMFQVRRQVVFQKIEEITFTPNVPGQYRFYCPMNGIEGVMVVRELASVGPSP